MTPLSRLAVALLFATASATVLAAGAADGISATTPYVRLMPPGAKTTAAFMTLTNNGDRNARLVKAETPIAKIAELHTHINDGGVMKMRQVPAIEIKAKGETALKPGSYHIMLIDPVGAVKEGDKVAITLGFDDGSSKKIEATVKKPEAAPAAMDHSSHTHMH